MPALAFAISAFDSLLQLPALIQAGAEVLELIKNTSKSLKAMQAEGRDPSDAEWEELNALVETLRSQRPNIGE